MRKPANLRARTKSEPAGRHVVRVEGVGRYLDTPEFEVRKLTGRLNGLAKVVPSDGPG